MYRLRYSVQRERTNSQMQSAMRHTGSGSPPPRTPVFVNNTVKIFQLPDISLSAGSKTFMVTRIWDTVLKSNTMTSYTDVAALMKQQNIPPIFGWEAEAKILD